MRTGEYPDDWASRRQKVLQRDEYECQKCSLKVDLEVDHIVPISKGGSHNIENLQVLCQECHHEKHPVQTKLRKAIDQNRRIRVKYRFNSGTRVRKEDPYGIGMYEGIQYLVSYDHYREEPRFFRPKKIEWIEMTDKTFLPPNNFDIGQFLSNNASSRQTDCFIATAAYGSPHAQEVDQLRSFRDTVLRESMLGTLFISVYYRTSPPIADWIGRSERRQKAVRRLIVGPSLLITEYIMNADTASKE